MSVMCSWVLFCIIFYLKILNQFQSKSTQTCESEAEMLFNIRWSYKSRCRTAAVFCPGMRKLGISGTEINKLDAKNKVIRWQGCRVPANTGQSQACSPRLAACLKVCPCISKRTCPGIHAINSISCFIEYRILLLGS